MLTRPEIIGHRGARGHYPENTLEGFDYALNIGCDALEMDLVITKNEELIVIHDLYTNKRILSHPSKTIDRKKRLFQNLTTSEIKEYRIGKKKNLIYTKQKKLSDSQIPTLKEFLDFYVVHPQGLAKKTWLNLEAKFDPKLPVHSGSRELFAEIFISTLKKYNLLDLVRVQCFDWQFLKILKKIAPHITIAPNAEKIFSKLPQISSQLEAPIICPHWRLINAKNLSILHSRHVKVFAWTVNTPRVWKKLADLGVDGIITDYPEEALKFFKVKTEKLR